MLKAPRDQRLTLRQLTGQSSATHLAVSGSPEQVADTRQHWLESGAADGFNIMTAELPKGISDFVDLVILILQKRGVYRTDYRRYDVT